MDLLSDEASNVILQFGNAVIGMRGDEMIRELMKRVDSFLREMAVNMDGPIVEQCKQQLRATKSALVDLLLRADEREAEIEMSASSSFRGQAAAAGAGCRDLVGPLLAPIGQAAPEATVLAPGNMWRLLELRQLLPATTRRQEKPERTVVTERG